MRHTISCLVRNQPGVLARIATAFGARGVNIHSLAVNESDADNVSRITVVLDGEQDQLSAMAEQTADLPDVVEVEDLAHRGFLDRELALVKVRCAPDNLPRLMQVCEVMRANVAALDRHSMTLEIAGVESKVSAFINLLRPFGILECARSGRVAVSEGDLP
jgi:acetolactate synthase-1/3 small subunit